jgi:O-antigen/teichoic acid export membrane protein
MSIYGHIETLRAYLAQRYPQFWGHRHFAYVFAEQSVTSGVNYATTMMLILGLPLAEYGRYAFVLSIITIFISFHNALLMYPMTCYLPHVDETSRPAALQGWVFKELLFLLLSTPGLFLAHSFVDYVRPQWGIGGLIVPMGVLMWSMMLQEFLRRYFLIQAMYKEMLAYSVISNITQLVVLIVLIASEQFDLMSVMLAMAITTFLAVLYALFRTTVFHPKRYKLEDLMLTEGLKLGVLNSVNSTIFVIMGQLTQPIIIQHLGFAMLGAVNALQSCFFGVALVQSSFSNYLWTQVVPKLKQTSPFAMLKRLNQFNRVLMGLIALQLIITGSMGQFIIMPKVQSVLSPALAYTILGLLGLSILVSMLFRGLDMTSQAYGNITYPSMVRGLVSIVSFFSLFVFLNYFGVLGLQFNTFAMFGLTSLLIIPQFYWRYRRKNRKNTVSS